MQCNPRNLVVKPIHVNETTVSGDNSQWVDKRLLLLLNCYFIIKYLSDDAIEEANETLENIREFYLERQTFIKPLPAPKVTIKGKLLPPKTRPHLVLDI